MLYLSMHGCYSRSEHGTYFVKVHVPPSKEQYTMAVLSKLKGGKIKKCGSDVSSDSVTITAAEEHAHPNHL